MTMQTPRGVRKGVLTNVRLVPKLSRNLFSVARFARDVGLITFDSTKCVATVNGLVWTIGKRIGKGPFQLDMTPTIANKPAAIAAAIAVALVSSGSTSVSKSYLWHLRLGHIVHGGLDTIVTNNLGGIDIGSANKWELCDGCAVGKQTLSTCQDSTTARYTGLLDLVHGDVCGPVQTTSFSGKRLFVSFIDDKSRSTVAYLKAKKSEVVDKFELYIKWTETQTGRRVKLLRSNNGGEYKSAKMSKCCASHGIVQQFTPPYTPQLNGLAEHAKLSTKYWGKALMTANFLHSRCPSRSNIKNKSPFEVWNGKSPMLASLKTFGFHAYVHVPSPKRQKLDVHAVLCRFVGYSEHEKAYRFEDIATGRVLVSRDDKFDDGPRVVGECVNADPVDSDRITTDVDFDSESGIDNSDIPADDNGDFSGSTNHISGVKRQIRLQSLEQLNDTPRPKRLSAATQLKTSSFDYLSEPHSAHVVHSVGNLPTTFASALESDDASKWREACDSLMKSDTWYIVPLPRGRKTIGCKCVFKAKENQHGEVERREARLVAKAFAQKYGIDYDETFASVAKFTSIRFVLALATKYDLLVHQADVKTAFLNGDLDEDIYMKKPDGCADASCPVDFVGI